MTWLNPCTIETTAITAAVPMTMPSVVSMDLILLAQIAFNAIQKFSRNTGRLRSRPRRVAHVADDLAVLQPHDARGVLGQVVLVGDEDDRVAAAVQVVHQREDLLAGLGVEVARSARRRAGSTGR